MMIIIIVCLFRVLGSGSVFGFRTWSVGCKVCLFFPHYFFFCVHPREDKLRVELFMYSGFSFSNEYTHS